VKSVAVPASGTFRRARMALALWLGPWYEGYGTLSPVRWTFQSWPGAERTQPPRQHQAAFFRTPRLCTQITREAAVIDRTDTESVAGRYWLFRSIPPSPLPGLSPTPGKRAREIGCAQDTV